MNKSYDYKRGLDEKVFKNVIDDCVNKIEGINEDDWQDIVDRYDLGIHRDVLRKAFQSPFGGYAIKRWMEEHTDDYSILKETEMKTIELEKEKKKMQDQRRELKKYIHSQARYEHLLQTMVESIKDLNNEKPIIYDSLLDDEYKLHCTNEAVLMCSDWHFGAKFQNILGEYNYDIAKIRISHLLNETLTYCDTHNVKTLHLELLGDMLSGAIHISSKVEAEEDVISQLIALCDELSNFITELSRRIPNVIVYTAIGNHSRLCMNIKENQDGENFERLLPYFLKHRLVNLKNVVIKEDCNLDDSIIFYNVLNTKIYGVHGDLDKPTSVVDNMIKLFKVIPDEIHMGHYHSDYEKTEYDIELVVNGSLQGTDTYAKRIRKSCKPLQKLRIYNEDGCLCEYKIKL